LVASLSQSQRHLGGANFFKYDPARALFIAPRIVTDEANKETAQVQEARPEVSKF
jgi:hypothetical protein